MSDHECTEEKRFEAVENGQTENKQSLSDNDMRQRVQGEHIAVMKDATQTISRNVEAFVTEIRGFMSQTIKDGARDAERLKMLEQDRERLYNNDKEIRDVIIPKVEAEIKDGKDQVEVRISDLVEKHIKPLEDRHLKESGRKQMLQYIPTILTALMAAAGLWALMTGSS
jgi:ASC-1-like (ASCH) protein